MDVVGSSTPHPAPIGGPLVQPGHEPPPDLVCSARGCRDSAVWALRWNNPRLHTPDRRKTWLACDQHRTSLCDHLSVRGFLKETQPVSALSPRG